MNILFVCTGNTCRSPMAEAILKKIADEKNIDMKVKSAGIYADKGSSASTNSVSSMRDIDIDIKDHRAQELTKELMDESDIILTMTSAHKNILIRNYPNKIYSIFSLNEYAFGKDTDIKDPYGGDRVHYDAARDEIISAIKSIYDHM